LERRVKNDKSIWFIPLSIKFKSKNISKIFAKQTDTNKIGKKVKWFKINPGQNGFYRVKYPKKILTELTWLVANKKLSNLDRWGLQNDLFALCMSSEIPLSEYLGCIKSYSNEDDYLVIKDIQDNLYLLYLISSKEKFWQKIREHKTFFAKNFLRLGWQIEKNEKHTDSLLRIQTIMYLGRFGEKRILDASKEKFQHFLKQPNSLHPDLHGVICSLAAWQGDAKTHQQITHLYREARTQEEKTRFLIALSGFRDTNLLRKTLDFSLSSEVRLQDTFLPIIATSNNPYGRNILWPWIKKNWKKLREKHGVGGKPLLGRIIKSISVVADREKEEEIKEFFKRNPVSGTERTLAQTLERLRINSNLLESIRRNTLIS
ncbi:MAG: ERAP1-like C-terminal domain-containing protein, partial [Candidatus Bathyarchaeota archaeon]